LTIDKEPAAITTAAAAASGERKLPPARKNISGPASHKVGPVVAQTPTLSTLGPTYEGVALSCPDPLQTIFASPIEIVESSTTKPLTITSYKGGVHRVSFSPKTTDIQSNCPSPFISNGPNATDSPQLPKSSLKANDIDIPQLPEGYLNTLDNPPDSLAVYNGENGNSFIFMETIVRSWLPYLIENGHLPDDVKLKTLQEKFDAIFGQKFYDRFPKDKSGRVTSLPAHLIKEITHSGDRELSPDEYNIPKLLAFFRAQDNLAGGNVQMKKLREKVASQMQYPFGTLCMPVEFEMRNDSGHGRLAKTKKRREDGIDRTFFQTIGHTVGRVAFPAAYLYSSYEQWEAGKLIFASVGNSGTVGDGFHMFEPIGIDKLKKDKPSDPAAARKSLVGFHEKQIQYHNWPLKLFHYIM
jgi:hypothetical protein